MGAPDLPNDEQIAELRAKRFTRRVALVTSVYAVALALATLGGSNATKEMLLAQQLASDQWAFYQAKVIREQLFRANRMRLEVDVAEKRGGADLERLRRAVAAEERRYAAEKRDIQRVARRHERERDLARTRDPYFDYAQVMLQIAIILASVSMLATSRPAFWGSVVFASLGALLTANGFLLFVTLPFLH